MAGTELEQVRQLFTAVPFNAAQTRRRNFVARHCVR